MLLHLLIMQCPNHFPKGKKMSWILSLRSIVREITDKQAGLYTLAEKSFLIGHDAPCKGIKVRSSPPENI